MIRPLKNSLLLWNRDVNGRPTKGRVLAWKQNWCDHEHNAVTVFSSIPVRYDGSCISYTHIIEKLLQSKYNSVFSRITSGDKAQ
jgi:hypothetical protein